MNLMALDLPFDPSSSNSTRTNSSDGSISSSSQPSNAEVVPPRSLKITDEIIGTPRWSSNEADSQKSLSYFYRSMEASGSPKKGLSNASSLMFGDPRLSPQSESVSQAFNRHTGIRADGIGGINAEAFTRFSCLSREERKEEYQRCSAGTGERELDGLLSEIASKLKQRTKMGAYQIRSTFKFFDRNGNGRIDFREFTQGVELMGFNYSDANLTALFAKFDDDHSGEIDYNEFVERISNA